MQKKLQVFVSSTFTDLKSERQAAVAAILKSGHLPAGMELFTAGDKSQWDTIKAWIDQSDVYMLILGGRYGSIEPSSNLSYTELEYQYALSQGKPNFAVVITQACIDRKVSEIGRDAIETINGKQLNEFREKVLRQMSSFFDDEKDIKLAVHETLSGFAQNPDLTGWVRASSVVDTKPMFDEITKLSAENAELRRLHSELERRIKTQSAGVDLDSLIKLLNETIIEVPDDWAINGNKQRTLLSIFRVAGSNFVPGITNSMGMSDDANFLFFNAGPKLQVHGLVDYERVPGAQYQRCKITKLGSSLLAEIERRKIEIKKQKTEASASTIGQSQIKPTIEPAEKPKKKAPRKSSTVVRS